jgi:hypothetical protein
VKLLPFTLHASLFTLLTTLLLTSCATQRPAQKPVKSGYNFSQIKRMALGRFEGQGGDAVGHEFVRQLVAAGFAVTDQQQNAEVVLSGTVTDYRPSDKMLVFIGTAKFPGAKDQPIEVTNPIVNSAAPTDISALGLPKIQVVAVSAGVAVDARLVDVKTGETVWANSDSYEGLTMPSAIQTMTTALVRSIRRVIPTGTSAVHS